MVVNAKDLVVWLVVKIFHLVLDLINDFSLYSLYQLEWLLFLKSISDNEVSFTCNKKYICATKVYSFALFYFHFMFHKHKNYLFFKTLFRFNILSNCPFFLPNSFCGKKLYIYNSKWYITLFLETRISVDCH